MNEYRCSQCEGSTTYSLVNDFEGGSAADGESGCDYIDYKDSGSIDEPDASIDTASTKTEGRMLWGDGVGLRLGVAERCMRNSVALLPLARKAMSDGHHCLAAERYMASLGISHGGTITR